MDIQMGEMSRARCVGRGEEPRGQSQGKLGVPRGPRQRGEEPQGPPHLPPSQYLWVLSNPEALWTLYFGALMEVHYHLINSIFSPSLSSRECEWAENSKLLIVAWSFWWPTPIQEPSRSHLIRTKDTLVTQEILRVSGDLCQVLRSKAKISTKDASSVLLT